LSGELEEIRRLLVEVQSQLAYQEDSVQALNEALVAQQQEIMVLRRQLQLLKQRQDEQLPGQSETAAERPPPHY
jgi:SlyX protein